MRVALVNTIKPQTGSADGITEYAYNLYEKLRKKNDVELVYALEKTKRLSTIGMLYAQISLRIKGAMLARADIDVVQITNQELGFIVGVLRLFGSRAKIVFTIHDLMRFGKTNFNHGILQMAYNSLVKRSIMTGLRNSDFIVYSAKSVEILTKERLKPKLPSAVILLAVKDEFVNTPIKQWKKKENLTIGYVGSLATSKNVIFILKTAESLKKFSKNFKFVIWGSGQEYATLVDYAKSKGLDNVKFMGFAPEKDLLKIYDSFDVTMFPTYGEGFGLPILDAQTRGLPVIALATSGVEAEVTKYCFKTDKPEEAGKILLDLRSKGFDSGLRKKMIEHAHKFTWDNVAAETMKVYKRLVTAKSEKD
jgi:glycosyltransferase involved in cell wall biosynthesis